MVEDLFKDISRDEAIALLRYDVRKWNTYREIHPDYCPDFREVDFSELMLLRANLNRVDFRGAKLKSTSFIACGLVGANLSGADLFSANFNSCDIQEADLSDANFSGANFTACNFYKSDLSGANLAVANFYGTPLYGANFDQAIFSSTAFSGLDLSSALNLEKAIHRGPSSISIDTLFKSHFNIPDVFLEGAGVSRTMIDYLHSFKDSPIQYYSCFISYSSKDEAFATRLYEGLKSNGIRVWYAPEEMKGGRFIHDQIDQAIRLHDKLLLVLSENSMDSTWVNTEIYKARKKEKQSGKKVLFPISIVPHEKVQDWECFDTDTGMDMARDIRQFYIPDFTKWKDHDAFQAEFEKLVRDLQASEEGK